MIQINLLPDVKRELLKAIRVRNIAVSVAIILSIAAVAIVVVLLLWMGAQQVRDAWTSNAIKDESNKLNKVDAIDEAVTIQNQLSVIGDLHDKKVIASRFFDMLVTINPQEPNSVAISSVTIDAEAKTIDMQAQATGGYTALEAFRKTIEATKLEYRNKGDSSNSDKQTVNLASQLSDSERNYANNAEGQKVLTFGLQFTYDEHLTSNTVEGLEIVGPTQRNATDSYVGVPESLFVQSARSNPSTSGENN